MFESDHFSQIKFSLSPLLCSPPPIVCKTVDPSESIVKETLDTYMRALLDMYERHRGPAGEHPNRKLVLMETRDKTFRFGNQVLKST